MIRYDVPPAPACHPEIGILLAALEDGTRHWREQLGDVDVETITWQPFSGGHSIGALMLHMADAEASWIETGIAGREFTPEDLAEFMTEETHQMAVDWPNPPARPIEYYDGILRRVRARTLETLREIQDPAEVRTERNEYTLRWIVAHIVHHESYHGGQAVFLKLLREKVLHPPH